MCAHGGIFTTYFATFQTVKLLFFFAERFFYKQLFFSYKIMGSVNVVFVKEEKESEKKVLVILTDLTFRELE